MELISVLILTYVVSGHVHESELSLTHQQCQAAEAALSKALTGPRKGRPTVELHNGRRVPVTGVQCLSACLPDGLEPLEVLRGEA